MTQDETLSAEVLSVLKGMFPKGAALHEPRFAANELKYVKECLDTGWVSSAGKYVDRFEAKLAEFTGAKHAVAVVNGTAALHACLLLSGVSRGDEVLIPALTFVATANAVAYCGAIPHLVDSDELTLGMDPLKLARHLSANAEVREGVCYNRATGRPIRAMMPMHTFGHAVDLDPLIELCQAYRLTLIEDAAESLGTYYKKKHTGNFGQVSALSFNGNKVITTGGGGAILTNDPALAKRAKHVTTTAKIPHAWDFYHDQVGFNYRLPNINAALGCAQLEELTKFLEQKKILHERYRAKFSEVRGVRIFEAPEFSRSNYWLNALILDEGHAAERDTILKSSNEVGIQTRPTWILMHRLMAFQDAPRMDLSTAESLSRRLICVPSSPFLAEL